LVLLHTAQVLLPEKRMVVTIEVVKALDLPALYKTVTPEKFFER
jgi:hypothetical protein